MKTSIINKGNTAINVTELSIGIVGVENRIILSTDFKGDILQPGQGYESGVNTVELLETLKGHTRRKTKIKIYAQARDILGVIYKGKTATIDFISLQEDVKYQSDLYRENTYLIANDRLNVFNTKKI